MRKDQIKLYYRNAMADVIGPEHGITSERFAELEKMTSGLIAVAADEANGARTHKNKTVTRYGTLTANPDIPKSVKRIVREIAGKCENLVVLGIGGSALGNIALQTALNPYMYNLDDRHRKDARLFVFDNVDPVQFGSFLDWVEPKLNKTIFNVVSKSGETAETASQFMIVTRMLEKKLGRKGIQRQVVATTDRQKGTLLAIAREYELRTLEVPDDVGGRFSVLSAVGLFSAAMCGINIDAMLEGARDMQKRTARPRFRENPAAVNAAIQYHYCTCGKPISVMLPYSYQLKDFADWFRQLWAESLGKAVDLDGREVHVGSTPIKALGATDQHSQVQLYREGPNDKVFTFLEVQDFGRRVKIGPAAKSSPNMKFLAGKDLGFLLNAERKATEFALLQDKRPCLTVVFPAVNAYTVGQFIYLYEATTTIAGLLLNIDTYNQPAVELGKHATFALMGKAGDYKQGVSYGHFSSQILDKTKIDGGCLI